MIPMLTTDTLSAEGFTVSLLGSIDDELRTGSIDLVPLGTRHFEVARHRQAGVGSGMDLSAGVAGTTDHGGDHPSG